MNRAILSTILILSIAATLLVASYQAVSRPTDSGIPDTTTTTNTSLNTNTTPTVVTPTLPTPTNVVIAATTSTTAKVTWSAIASTSGETILYQVWRNDQKIAAITRTEFLDVFLVPGQTVSYTIIASTIAGAVSDRSVVAQATLPKNSTVVATPSTPSSSNTNTSKPTTNTNTPAKNTNTSKPTTNTNTSKPPTNTNTAPLPTNTNTAPPPPAPTCGSGGSCTAADVAKHATRSNCWVYLSPLNKVYNITSYVSNGNKHPGGDVIAQYCGQNIYSYFIGSAGGHRHSNSALNSILAAYYIAAFQP